MTYGKLKYQINNPTLKFKEFTFTNIKEEIRHFLYNRNT